MQLLSNQSEIFVLRRWSDSFLLQRRFPLRGGSGDDRERQISCGGRDCFRPGISRKRNAQRVSPCALRRQHRFSARTAERQEGMGIEASIGGSPAMAPRPRSHLNKWRSRLHHRALEFQEERLRIRNPQISVTSSPSGDGKMGNGNYSSISARIIRASGRAQPGAAAGGKPRPSRIARHRSAVHAGPRSQLRLGPRPAFFLGRRGFDPSLSAAGISRDRPGSGRRRVGPALQNQSHSANPRERFHTAAIWDLPGVNTPRRRPVIISGSGAKTAPGTGNWHSSFCTLVRRRGVG